MNVYHYDLQGYSQGSSEANPNPLEPGQWLVPANATLIEPPTPGEGQVAQFDTDSQSWALVTDPSAILAKHVVFWRVEDGKDEVVLGGGLYGDFMTGDGLRFNGVVPDGSAGVGHTVYDEEPAGWNTQNENGVYTKKMVDDEVVARDSVDVTWSDHTALSTKFVVFYRDVSGKDKKVISGINYGSALIAGTEDLQMGGTPLSDPSMAEVSGAIFDSMPAGYADKNSRRVPTKKVNDALNAIVDRDAGDISVDIENKAGIEAEAEDAVRALLLSETGENADYTTHLMKTVWAQDVLMNQGDHDAGTITQANAVMTMYRPLFVQIQQIRNDRDAEIAELEE